MKTYKQRSQRKLFYGHYAYQSVLAGTKLEDFIAAKFYRLHAHADGNYTMSQKKGATLTMAITLSILGVFAKFFRCCKEQQIRLPTTP